MTFRRLHKSQICLLEKAKCYAENWNNILIHPETDLSNIRNVRFYGKVTVGAHNQKPTVRSLADGSQRLHRPGIYDCTLKDAAIGDNVMVEHCRYLSHLKIDDEAALLDVSSVSHTIGSTCGQGLEINPMIETGGRSLPLWEGWSCSTAEAFLFHFTKAQKKAALKEISVSLKQKKHKKSLIGKKAWIENSGRLHNVCIGAHASILGTQLCENITLLSSAVNPVYIGASVIITDALVKGGSRIVSGAIVKRSMLDEDVKIGDQAFIRDSLVWPYSEIFLSEVISCVFGPFAVTHHRASLHIAGKFSFYNAGSGCNYSNHNYRLGPMHQGILERGTKVGSGAYVLFPARIGSYTTLIGAHKNHPDTRDFPFSLLYEEQGTSYLIPGYNFLNIGSYRDEKKMVATRRCKIRKK